MTGSNSFDEFVRNKVQEAQDMTVNLASDNANKTFNDLFNPFEIRMSA